MGYILKAVCPCGLASEEIYQGIGFGFPETGYDGEPAFCNTCGIVAGKDASKRYSKCPSCRKKMTFYKEGFEEINPKSPFDYPTSDYLESREFWHCTNCKQETLRFENWGCWD